MWATVGEFGLVSCLRAIRANRDVKGGVGVNQSRGENVRRSQVSAKDEPGDLHLSRAVTRLGSCVHQRGESVVPALGLAHSAGVEGAVLAGCARQGFATEAEVEADRVSVLLGLHHGAVMWVQAPHPRMIDLSVSKFLLMHLEQA